MAIDRLLTGNISRQVKELMATEDLVVETFRDLVKDELKAYVRDKIEKDEELRQELKEAVSYYFHAKARSLYAELKATRQQHVWDYAYCLMKYKVNWEKHSLACLKKSWANSSRRLCDQVWPS